MRKVIFLIFLTVLCGLTHAVRAQKIAIKTNTLYWAMTTPNLGIELGLSNKTTLDVLGAYNPWTFEDDKKMHFWLVQPEIRYWLCEKFEGHFFGAHAHGAQYFGGFDKYRYDGYLAGAGISYGYNWILGSHWNLEATVGVGYAYLWYKQSPRIPCVKCRKSMDKHYFGPTKAAISFVYLF